MRYDGRTGRFGLGGLGLAQYELKCEFKFKLAPSPTVLHVAR